MSDKKVRAPRQKLAGVIEMESGIPIPEFAHARSRKRVYPIDELRVGESFSFPMLSNIKDRHRQLRSLRSAIHTYQRAVAPNTRFVAIIEEREGKLRCWRIADEPAA
jgi:hypothetical protein